MLGLYFHIDMIWIDQRAILFAYIAWLKATNALLKVTMKFSKFPRSQELV